MLEPLRDAGYDTTHLAEVELLTATDPEFFDHAVGKGLAVVTADSNFPILLALRRAKSPSVIHLRHVAELGPDEHAKLLLATLPTITDDLERGAIVSMSRPGSPCATSRFAEAPHPHHPADGHVGPSSWGTSS